MQGETKRGGERRNFVPRKGELPEVTQQEYVGEKKAGERRAESLTRRG